MSVYRPGKKQYDIPSGFTERDIQEWEYSQKIQEKTGCPEEVEQHLIDLVKAIDGIGLDPEYKDDAGKQIDLNEAKATAKKLLLRMLTQVKDYITTGKRLEIINSRREELDIKDYQTQREFADRAKKAAHEALMSDINIFVRFVRTRFSTMKEEEIWDYEEKEEEAGRRPVYAKRIKFDTGNIICSDKIDLSDRDEIALWAEQVFECLTTLKNRLENIG